MVCKGTHGLLDIIDAQNRDSPCNYIWKEYDTGQGAKHTLGIYQNESAPLKLVVSKSLNVSVAYLYDLLHQHQYPSLDRSYLNLKE